MIERRWDLKAACLEAVHSGAASFSDFYPRSSADNGGAYAKARAICETCTVSEACLEEAMNDENDLEARMDPP